MIARALVFLALLTGAAPLRADPPGADAPLTFPAVGRISYGDRPLPGAAICSATLVAPDLILTAGHCVKDAVPQAVHFAAGYRHGRSAGGAQGVAVIRPAAATGLAGDLALVRLDHALAGVDPLPLAAREVTALRMLAYRRDAPQMRDDVDCRVIVQQGAALGLRCPAVSGNSGAPLLQRTEQGWQVVAVMVAQDRQNRIVRSYAVVPPADLVQAIRGQ
ncbi:MAG: serine protease [Paracoccaceae bacterium]